MYASANQGVAAYSRVGMETAVVAADAHKLILMLYEGAMIAVADAKQHIQHKRIAAKGASISKAIAIIDGGLRASLDVKAGGELGERLAALYRYMSMRLLHANVKNDIKALDEVARLLGELNGAWAAIGKKQPVQPAAAAPVLRAAHSYGKA
ncbi:MAG TPA: flagellar export chaperone FliS [Burkholderiales bacterium]|nr:flagellar export chaperone FliS [Burkholderiales bacterium]